MIASKTDLPLNPATGCTPPAERTESAHPHAATRMSRRKPPRNTAPAKSGRWLLTLFALPFAGVGIGMLLLSVLPTLHDWTRMQSWQPVDATLLSARLNVHSGKSRTYSVSARYRFEVAGRVVEGQRVAITEGADNIGDFQQRLGTQLEQALARGQSVRAWADPAHPSDAVIDRSLRGGLLAFKMVFVLVFGAVGIGLLVFTWRSRPETTAPSGNADPSPWLARREWADNQIRSSRRLEMVAIWCFAIVWNLLALPVTAASLPQHLRQNNLPVVLALAAFVSAGLGLLAWAVSATRDARRFGDLRLVLDPFPGAIGGDFGATLDLPTVPWQGDQRFLVTLRCIQHYRTRSAGESSTEAREQTVWQTEGMAQVEPHGSGSRLRFRFAVPGALPASEAPANDYHAWRLRVESTGSDLGLDRSFDVPVYATGASAHHPIPDAAQHPALQPLREAQIDEISDLEAIAGGVRLYQPYARGWRTHLPLALMGGAFAGIGLFAGARGAPLLFPIVFGSLGGALLCYALFGLTNSLRVDLGTRGLRVERRILGLRLHWRQVPPQDIARLRLKESYTTQSGTRSTTYYRVQVELRNGQAITVADSLRGRETAGHLLRTLAERTGYSGGP